MGRGSVEREPAGTEATTSGHYRDQLQDVPGGSTPTMTETTAPRPALPSGSATIDDFGKLDIRVGRVTEVSPFPTARRPAYQLTIDFGPLGVRRSSAQLPPTYPDRTMLEGRLVVCVINFAPRRIAGFQSEVLVLGALPEDGRIPLLSVDEGALPGDPIG